MILYQLLNRSLIFSAKVIIFADSNVITCCPERKSEYVVHMLRNAHVYQVIRCSSALRTCHPENVLFQCILMSTAEAMNGLSALLLGILYQGVYGLAVKLCCRLKRVNTFTAMFCAKFNSDSFRHFSVFVSKGNIHVLIEIF